MRKVIKVKKLNILLAFVLIVLGLSMAGCTYDSSKNNDSFSIVTVNFVQYDFARAICGGDENITMIMKPGAEIHGFEPSLADIEAIANADVFIYNGGESDTWIDNIFESINNESIKTVVLMNHAVLLEERHEGHSHTHSHNHKEHNHDGENNICQSKVGYDEHIWTSPQNAKLMLDAICNTLCEANPEMEAVYRKNTKEYMMKIEEIHNELQTMRKNAKTNFIAVGDKFPFLYLVHEYDLEYMAAFPGCSHEYDASPSVIIDIIETVKEKNTDIIFYTETSDERMADTICGETGAKKLMLHSCQAISREHFEAGKTYVDFMKENTKNLKEALS